MTKNEISELVSKVHSLEKSHNNTLPNNSYFLEENTILCYPNEVGDSRYPYYHDGLVLFAHSDGYIDCVEGLFNVFKLANYNEDTPVAFFAGEKYGDSFFPYSITGAAKQLFENDVTRYTIFTPVCVYYIVETPKAIFAVRAYINKNKNIRFSVGAVNLAEDREIYLCSYFEPSLRFHPFEDFFKRMTKYGEHYKNGGYVIKGRNTSSDYDCLAVRTAVDGDTVKRYFTTAKNTFVGNKGGNVTNATALKNGCYLKEAERTNTTDFPIVSDMVHFSLQKDGFACIDYEMKITVSPEEAEAFAGSEYNASAEDISVQKALQEEKSAFDRMNINFHNWNSDKLNANVLNSFIKCVQRQVSFCALGKNYAGEFLGVRDVFQQLESSLIWHPAESRAQIVKVMNLILSDGRAPRQISFPTQVRPVPKMDLRPYIDQGFWIISTLHTYLSFTDDYSVLDEICGYFAVNRTMGPVKACDQKDSVLCHLIRITDFLISNLDEKTNCIHALYGDWNDALDGLGKTKDKTKEFGDGVSVMATLQLYLTLTQMTEIISATTKDEKLLNKYAELKDRVAKGILDNAIVKDETGKARMSHGWGEGQSYYVGSYNDYDGKSRISLTAHAFAAISGILENYPEYKEDIVKNILSLDSKYGLLTFSTPFDKFAPEVGRISTITPGTYENCCTYVHAGTFGVMALFLLGHPQEAWEELRKVMVISHENVTMTTFVMPNSYCKDEIYGFDGESMGDWYTGSGTVLIKDIVKCGFGIEPNLSGVKIAPAGYFPSKTAEITINVKGCTLNVRYENLGLGRRKMTLNGKELPLEFDSLRNIYYAQIDKAKLSDNTLIVVTD